MGCSNRQKCCNIFLTGLRNNLQVILPLIGAIVAIAIGLPLAKYNISDDVIMWIEMPGTLYIRGLKLSIVPLITSCCIVAASALDFRQHGKVGAAAVGWNVLVNLLGATLGVCLGAVFNLGNSVELSGKIQKLDKLTPSDAFADLLRNAIPDNVISTCFRSTQTFYKLVNITNGTEELKREIGTAGGINVLGLMMFSLALGVGANLVGEAALPIIALAQAVMQVMVKLVAAFMWTTVVGVFSLVLAAMLKLEDPAKAFEQLGIFSVANLIGFIALMFIVFPLMVFIARRENPYKYFVQLIQPYLLAFSAASSLSALPAMLQAADKWDCDKRIAQFALPLSCALGASGSSVFMATSTILLSTASGVSLQASDYFIIWILVTFLAMALPGVPSSSLVAIVVILTSVGAPITGIGLLFATEWLLDRLRTGVNCVGTSFSCLFADGIARRAMGVQVSGCVSEDDNGEATGTRRQGSFGTDKNGTNVPDDLMQVELLDMEKRNDKSV